ncbi:hypothetical protein NEIRO03_0372 [Nematocida sp. AWRm78]|nr:hypothetical protein NEIRO02_0384 [Nematocida sp. AWRm79]KAI5182721.1 hypothetical protein NEIRO03_0372 [Nematocida sp. AWRm78]
MDWLDDTDINLFLKVIVDSVEHAAMVGYPIVNPDRISTLVCSSFYFESLRKKGMECISRWVQSFDLTKISNIIFPLYSDSHWSLCYIDVKAETAIVYDSMRPMHSHLSKVLLTHSFVKIVLYSERCAQQKNGYDCGCYALYYATCIIRRKRGRLNLEVPHKFIKRVRIWIKQQKKSERMV